MNWAPRSTLLKCECWAITDRLYVLNIESNCGDNKLHMYWCTVYFKIATVTLTDGLRRREFIIGFAFGCLIPVATITASPAAASSRLGSSKWESSLQLESIRPAAAFDTVVLVTFDITQAWKKKLEMHASFGSTFLVNEVYHRPVAKWTISSIR